MYVIEARNLKKDSPIDPRAPVFRYHSIWPLLLTVVYVASLLEVCQLFVFFVFLV